VKKATVMLNGKVSLNAVTDASGHFAFRQLPAGQYEMEVRSERYHQCWGRFRSSQSLACHITCAEEREAGHWLVAHPGASVRGRIVDEDGNPMPRCNVKRCCFAIREWVGPSSSLVFPERR